jgi:hypothetical protein
VDGATVTITATATGDGGTLHYTWSSTTGAVGGVCGDSNVCSFTANGTYNGIQVTVSMSGATPTPASVLSPSTPIALTITAVTPKTGMTGPTCQTALAGSTTTCSVTAADALQFQWQVSIDGGTTWFNVPHDYTGSGGPNVTGTGATSATFTTATLTSLWDQLQFQVLLSNGFASNVASPTAATLTVSYVEIDSFSGDSEVDAGSSPTFTVSATTSTAGTLSYEWHEVDSGSTQGSAGDHTISTATCAATAASCSPITSASSANDGQQFYVKVSDGLSPLYTAVSEPITLLVD